MAYQSAHTGQEIDSAVSGVMTAMGEDFSDPLAAQSDITEVKNDIADLQNQVESDIADLQNQLNQARPITKTLSWSGDSAPYTATITITSAASTSVDPMVWVMGTDHNRYYCDYSVTHSGSGNNLTYVITIHSNYKLSGTVYIYGIVAPR